MVKNLSRKIVIGILSIALLSMFCGTASAWLTGYDYRMLITVNNGGASELTNYQFNFTNDTDILVAEGHMQASGADCRITDASDNLIPFWNETAFNTTETKMWANATTLAVGDNTFYMYYGNAGASSVSDISGTFVFGDNFSVSPPLDAWTRYVGNPIIPATSEDWDYGFQVKPSAIYQGSEYKLYYYGATDDPNDIPRKIGMANGTDGYNFTKQGVVLSPSVSEWDNGSVMDPTIMYYNTEYWLYYGGQTPNQGAVTGEAQTGLAKSDDGVTFTRITNGIGGTSKVLDRGDNGEWDYNVAIGSSCVYYDGYFWLYYWGRPANANDDISIGLAKSTDGVNFTKITNGLGGTSKVLTTDGTSAEGKGVMRPSIFRYDNKWHMFYIRSHTDNSKRIGYAYSTDGVSWTRSINNPVLDIGTADWENDYLPGVSVIFKEGNENNKCIMYYQGAYATSKPTNRLAIANQTTAHNWDGSGDVNNCKWAFSSTDAINIEDGVMKVKAVTGGHHADVKSTYKPNFTEINYDFVQEFDYKPTAGFTYYGITSIGAMEQNSYAGGNNATHIWHYGGEVDGEQTVRWRMVVDSVADDGTNIAPYATNEPYKFQSKKLGGNVTCKIWNNTYSETSPIVEDNLTAKDNYNFPYVALWTRPGYTQPAVEVDNYRIRKLVSSEPTSSIGTEETGESGGAYNITLPAGWNIIGWTDTTPHNAEYMETLIGTNCTYSVAKNITSGLYETHQHGFDLNNFDAERGWGYYVHVTDETIWERDS